MLMECQAEEKDFAAKKNLHTFAITDIVHVVRTRSTCWLRRSQNDRVISVGLDMLLQVLGTFEGFATKFAFMGLQRHVHTNVRSDVITLHSGGAAASPLAGQIEIIGALAAYMALANMFLHRHKYFWLRATVMNVHLHRVVPQWGIAHCSLATGRKDSLTCLDCYVELTLAVAVLEQRSLLGFGHSFSAAFLALVQESSQGRGSNFVVMAGSCGCDNDAQLERL